MRLPPIVILCVCVGGGGVRHIESWAPGAVTGLVCSYFSPPIVWTAGSFHPQGGIVGLLAVFTPGQGGGAFCTPGRHGL